MPDFLDHSGDTASGVVRRKPRAARLPPREGNRVSEVMSLLSTVGPSLGRGGGAASGSSGGRGGGSGGGGGKDTSPGRKPRPRAPQARWTRPPVAPSSNGADGEGRPSVHRRRRRRPPAADTRYSATCTLTPLAFDSPVPRIHPTTQCRQCRTTQACIAGRIVGVAGLFLSRMIVQCVCHCRRPYCCNTGAHPGCTHTPPQTNLGRRLATRDSTVRAVAGPSTPSENVHFVNIDDSDDSSDDGDNAGGAGAAKASAAGGAGVSMGGGLFTRHEVGRTQGTLVS